MADDVLPSRTERLSDRRRRLRLRVAAGVGALAVVGGAAAFAVTAGSDPAESNEPSANRAAATPVSLTPEELPALREVTEDAPPRVVSNEAPLRLWVGGDSLAGALGPALGQIAGASGVVQTEVDYRVSSGLADDGVRDWSEHAAEAMEEYDPEAVVFVIGTNDASIVSSRTDANGVPEWEPRYRLEVARMMDLFVGGDARRTVFWVGAPTMRTDWRDRGVVELNRVMREEAALRSEDVVYVDAYDLFSGDDGGFAERVTTFGGDEERVRIDDGVHFTGDGAEYLATAVFALLDARWDIWDHADPDHPIDYHTARGSGGGGSSGGSSGSGSGGSGSGGGNGDNGGGDTGATTTSATVDDSPTTTAEEATTTSAPASSTSAAPTTTAAPTSSSAAPTTTVAPSTTTAPPPTSSPSPPPSPPST